MSHPRILSQSDHASPSTGPSMSSDSPPSRKRKRSVDQPAADLFDAFTVSDALSQLSLHPRLLLPRSIFPLSYLDLYSESRHSPPCRVFASASSSLQAALHQDSALGPSLLIVSPEDSSQLLVVDPLADQTYTLSRLVPWLTLTSLESLAKETPKLPPLRTSKTAQSGNAGHWWSQTIVEVNQPALSNKDFGPGDRVLWEAQASANAAADASFNQPPESQLDPPCQDLTPQRVCCDVVLQYLEVLYLSKASLAYFPKGSLSRARAFANASGRTPSTDRLLASALREMIFTGATFEKKYTTKLPESLKALPADDDGPHANSPSLHPRREKAKQLKKPKPSKDGLFVVEIDYLQKWWQNDGSGSAGDDSLKARLASLRLRESLLQIILILEVLALEASDLTSAPKDAHAGSVDTQESAARGIESQSQSARPKKPKNLDLALELLADRVCIWRSIDFGDESPSKTDTSHSGRPSQRNDVLKEFYVDVLIPFYSSRLPKKVEGLAQRMGIAVKPSPHKRFETRKRRRTEPTAPGSEIQRKPPPQRRGPMHRTVSESKRKTGALPTPPLSRSSTDTMLLQDIKRERSCTPHDESRAGRKGLSRASSISGGRAFNQREIDLTALNEFRANKDKKKPSVDQELKDAIALLKKPNRSLTAREFADAAEKRVPGPAARRPTKSKLGVEIGVTPRREERTVGLDSIKPAPLQPINFIGASPHGPSTGSAVPASVIRDSGVKMGKTRGDVLETPSRGPSKKIDAFRRVDGSPDDADEVVPHSAVKAPTQTSPCLAKKTAPRLMSKDEQVKSRIESPGASAETPLKQTKGKEKSIYDMLGWDDEDELA